jgi:acyl-CoA thioesterase
MSEHDGSGKNPEAERVVAVPGRRRSPFMALLGATVELGGPGEASAWLEVEGHHLQLQGAVHGGVAFSIADTAMGAAIRTLMQSTDRLATIEAKINYLAPVKEGRLIAKAMILHKGGTLCFGEADVFNERDGQRARVAKFTATFMVRTKRQPA